jgi:hypothetical protein
MRLQEKDMSANERLQGLQTALDESGVQDVKFFFSCSSDTPASHVVADAEHVLRAYLDGNVRDLPILGDSVRT